MIRSHVVLLTITIAIAVGGSSQPLAQQKSASAAQPKLAIEIVDGQKRRIPAPVFAPPSEGGLEMGTTKPLPDWKQTKGEAPLTGIRIHATLEGDAVRIKVAGVFDDSFPVDAPGPKYGPVEKPIGSYLARKGETVKVGELAALGFEPLVIKVVPYVREVEAPPLAPIPPQVTNNLKSVEVIGLLPMAELSSTYRLTVRNISNKTIVALDVYVPRENGSEGVTAQGNAAHPVMKPGAMHEVLISESRGGRMADLGYVPDKPSRKVIVGTVVFDDETYEGEPQTAVHIIGSQTGQRLQFARAVLLLQKTLESRDKSADAALKQLKADVWQLRIDVDGQAVDDLLARFPELPKSYPRNSLAEFVMQGLKEGRQNVSYRIKDIEEAPRNPGSVNLVWQRLNSLKEELETDLAATKQASIPRVDQD